MRVLVTGGAGFIGSNIVDTLIQKNHQITIFDNLEPQVHKSFPEYLNKKAKFVSGDIRDKKKLIPLIKDADIIFHEASAVGVGQSMYEIEKYVGVSTYGTAVLLDCLVNIENNVKKLIVAGSMAEYGEGKYECLNCGIIYPGLRPEKQLKKRVWEHLCPNCKKPLKHLPTDELKPVQPYSIYAQTKRHQEEMCLLIGKTYGIPVVSLRYFNVYGPRQSLNNPYTGTTAIFSSRILNNNPPIIFEDGLQTRDFINVKDVARANLLAMENKNADYEIFNVGLGKPVNILKVAEVLIEKYNSNVKPEVTGQFRKGDIRHCYADILKIKNKLEFEPKISFEEGMSELVNWLKTQKSEDLFEKAKKELEDKKLLIS